jgi:hypothetical protein
MDVKVGARLASVVCGTEVVVVRAPQDGVPEIGCGGQPVVPLDEATQRDTPIDPSLSDGTQLGKRYEGAGVELLCTSAGEGTLTVGGEAMSLKSAKPLPASD